MSPFSNWAFAHAPIQLFIYLFFFAPPLFVVGGQRAAFQRRQLVGGVCADSDGAHAEESLPAGPHLHRGAAQTGGREREAGEARKSRRPSHLVYAHQGSRALDDGQRFFFFPRSVTGSPLLTGNYTSRLLSWWPYLRKGYSERKPTAADWAPSSASRQPRPRAARRRFEWHPSD